MAVYMGKDFFFFLIFSITVFIHFIQNIYEAVYWQ